jgi:type IV secretory pathway VirB6-like protein
MTNSDYLTMAENRFASVQRYFPNSSEFNRLFNIILDMTSKMSPEERDMHNAKKIETPAAKAARLKEEQRVLDQMSMNKDSNSI